MLSVSRKLVAVAIFGMMVNVSSAERREFVLSLKFFFDVGHEHIS